ncbi:P-loop containing nucleoside triphosphate hydrolase protein [Microthyrium microscopicum]|uniref:DNA repair protein RAD51 homolog 3 n=1 Tax=Microthyrium microscopicum TaxID=703497 RepID=A0A6A6UQ07_9PEZI|nr:P-loop containing nucleoside triphosphate hydrolase protein [Microthyrium microscopicum]
MGSQVPSTGNIPSSSHRLPAISASDALRQLRDSTAKPIPTGLPNLDNILVGSGLAKYGRGGLVRGQLTEIFAPPGSGKTALCLSAATSVLVDGGHVVWIDCLYSLPLLRLQAASSVTSSDIENKFHRYQAPTLAHLLALVHRQKKGFPPENTALIVLEDVSCLFPLPPAKTPGQKPAGTPMKSTQSILQSTLLSALSRIASTHNIAVLITSQVSTRIRQFGGALLVTSMSSRDWDEPIASRIVLFRDFPPPSLDKEEFEEERGPAILQKLRYAGIMKAHGVGMIENDRFKDVYPFSITSTGVVESVVFPTISSAPALIRSPAPTRKRKLDQVIPDSDEEWDAEVDSLDGYDFDENEEQVLAVRPLVEIPGLKGKKVKVNEDNEEIQL